MLLFLSLKFSKSKRNQNHAFVCVGLYQNSDQRSYLRPEKGSKDDSIRGRVTQLSLPLPILLPDPFYPTIPLLSFVYPTSCIFFPFPFRYILLPRFSLTRRDCKARP